MATGKFTPRRRRGSRLPSPSHLTQPEPSAGSRRLMVRSHYPGSRRVLWVLRPDPAPMPFLHLQGRWLDRAGFAIGADVRVVATPRRLVIEVIKDGRPSEQASSHAPRLPLA